MTAIIAIEDGDTVWMGGDTCVGDGETQFCQVGSKVWLHPNGYVIGGCGNARPLTILEHVPRLPKIPSRGDIDRFAVLEVGAAFQRALEDHGLEDEARTCMLLVGFAGRVYSFEGGTVPLRSADGYAAIGSGGPVALGSLATSKGSARSRVSKALHVAEKHAYGVRRPFTILSV